MTVFIFVLWALILIVLYNKEIDSKKGENSQLGFYIVISLIIIVILLFVADMLSKWVFCLIILSIVFKEINWSI